MTFSDTHNDCVRGLLGCLRRWGQLAGGDVPLRFIDVAEYPETGESVVLVGGEPVFAVKETTEGPETRVLHGWSE